MKNTAILLAGTAALIAAPAQARDGQWYIGADAGVSLEDQVDVDFDEANANGLQTNGAFADTELGLDVAGVVGYDFGAIRLEGELGYKRAGFDTLTILDPALVGGTAIAPGTAFASEDNLSVFSGMLNLLLEFGKDDGFQIYGGGGVGAANVNLELSTPTPTPIVDDDATDIAWQLLGGFRFAINDRIDLGVRYRYFNISEFDFQGVAGQTLEADYAAHSVLASLRVNLGSKKEAPPPLVENTPPEEPVRLPPPPPVFNRPPAPPVQPCNTGPYIVFFDWDESVLTQGARSTLDQAVSAYANCGAANIMLAGHTDRSGSVAYNNGLAQRRNTTVANYLTGKGIPAARISANAFGEAQPRKQTPDGVREQENRRVEINYGPGSGR
jgi:outer membrane protein OmpA-like peptidoglycan-associated protein